MKYAVYCGRFQPFHLGHLSVIQQALEECDRLIIVLGSYRAARDLKNPWTDEEREQMISASLTSDMLSRIVFTRMEDYLYNDNLWVSKVYNLVSSIAGKSKVCLYGFKKDHTSAYLDMFPQWELVEVKNVKRTSLEVGGEVVLSSTYIRSEYFKDSKISFKIISSVLPPAVQSFLVKWKIEPEYKTICEEQSFVTRYKQSWATAPFPPTFVTVDCVVIRSGHVLVVARKGNPGAGLIALPGGFVNQEETLKSAALRELKEETRIDMPKPVLEGSIVTNKTFDHPSRSLRGRTLTTAYLIDLKQGELPKVKGSDDAAKAWWMPLSDVEKNRDKFFEDHFFIIQDLIGRL